MQRYLHVSSTSISTICRQHLSWQVHTIQNNAQLRCQCIIQCFASSKALSYKGDECQVQFLHTGHLKTLPIQFCEDNLFIFIFRTESMFLPLLTQTPFPGTLLSSWSVCNNNIILSKQIYRFHSVYRNLTICIHLARHIVFSHLHHLFELFLCMPLLLDNIHSHQKSASLTFQIEPTLISYTCSYQIAFKKRMNQQNSKIMEAFRNYCAKAQISSMKETPQSTLSLLQFWFLSSQIFPSTSLNQAVRQTAGHYLW